MGLFPLLPEVKDSVCLITSILAPSHHLSPLPLIWQESILPAEARLIITMNLLLYVPRVLFLNATVPYVVNILCPDQRHGHEI